MPSTCCKVQPSIGVTRAAAVLSSFAPPTWSTRRLDRSARRWAWASSQSIASGGTNAVTVTRSALIRAKQVSGSGRRLHTTRPPASKVPITPGQHRVKLCAMGRAARYTVCWSRPHTALLARTL
ncbi:hypothetical protein D3C79_720490 [compost metagenome]